MNYVAIGKVTGVRHSIMKNSKRQVTVDWVESSDDESAVLLGHSFQFTDEQAIFNIGNDVEIRVTRLAEKH